MKDIQKLEIEARQAREKRNYKRAADIYAQIINLDPENPRWPHMLGECHQRLGNRNEAISAFKQGVDFYAVKNQLPKAVALCKMLISMDPGNRRFHELMNELKVAQAGGQSTFTQTKESQGRDLMSIMMSGGASSPDSMGGIYGDAIPFDDGDDAMLIERQPHGDSAVIGGGAAYKPTSEPEIDLEGGGGVVTRQPAPKEAPAAAPPPEGGGYPPAGQYPAPPGYPPGYGYPGQPPPGYPPGYGYPPQGAPYPQQPPQGYPPYPPQGGYPPGYGYPPQGMPYPQQPPQGYPPYPPQGYPPYPAQPGQPYPPPANGEYPHYPPQDPHRPGMPYAPVPADGDADDGSQILPPLEPRRPVSQVVPAVEPGRSPGPPPIPAAAKPPPIPGRKPAGAKPSARGTKHSTGGLELELNTRDPEARAVADEADGEDMFELPLEVVAPDKAAPTPPARPAREDLPPIPLLASLEEEALQTFLGRVDLLEHPKGEVIVQEGTKGDALFILVRGEVIIYQGGRQGKVLNRLKEGAFFGEIALLTNQKRTASVEAVTDCRTLKVSLKVMNQLVQEHPKVLKVILGFVRERLIENLIETHELFAPFAASERWDLMQRFSFIEAPRRSTLIKEGERSPGLFLLVCGEVALARGGKPFEALGMGALFGKASMLSNTASDYTAVTASKCWLLKLGATTFREIIMTHPHVLAIVSEPRNTGNLTKKDVGLSWV